MLEKIKKEFDRSRRKLFRSGRKHKQSERTRCELDNLPYELYDKITNGGYAVRLPHIEGIDETLERIVDGGCSMSRFGDGEFGIMFGSRIRYHDRNPGLAQRLKEVIRSDDPKLLIGLPPCFGSLDCFVPSTIDFWRKWMSKKRAMVYSCLSWDRIYYNAFFNRFYLNYNKTDEHIERCSAYFDKLNQIWKDRDVVLFEGQQARLGVGNDVLSGARSISRIVFCPIRNAFDRYDEIVSAFDGIASDVLVLISLGPTATVLAHDLCNKGYQALDVGDINAEYEYFLRREKPFETGNAGKDSAVKHASDPNDPEYRKQIVKTIV